MYQEVSKLFADFILFKVDKWIADFSFACCRVHMKVDAPNANFTLFIVDNVNADFRKKILAYKNQGKDGKPVADFTLKTMQVWGEAGKPDADFSVR